MDRGPGSDVSSVPHDLRAPTTLSSGFEQPEEPIVFEADFISGGSLEAGKRSPSHQHQRCRLHETTLADAMSSGDVRVNGNQEKLKELVSYLDTFEFWFNIVTP
ncbi:MAG: alkyl sulfatase C-terminal domain-containing protein [Pseudomonadota bacterium]